MAAPAFGSVGTYLQGSVASADIAVPAGVTAGDVIVIPIFINGATTLTGLASGFAEAPGSPIQNVSGEPHGLHVVWKRATGADTGVYSFPMSATDFMSSGALRYTSVVGTGSPWDVTTSGNGNDTSSTTTPPVSVTTTGLDRLLLFAGTNWSGGGWTPPAGFTERIDSGFAVVTADDRVQAVAGSSGTVQATSTSSARTVAWLGALIGTTVIASGTATLTAATSVVAGATVGTSTAAVLSATTSVVAGAVRQQPAGAILGAVSSVSAAGDVTPARTNWVPQAGTPTALVTVHAGAPELVGA